MEVFMLELQYFKENDDYSFKNITDKYGDFMKHKKCQVDLDAYFKLVDCILEMAKTNSEARKLLCRIIRHMMADHKLSERSWDKLAKLHANGFLYETARLFYPVKSLFGIMRSICIYEDGLMEVEKTHNKHKLWILYINHVIDLCESPLMESLQIKEFMDKTLEHVFRKAHHSGVFLEEKQYIYWARNTTQNDPECMLTHAAYICNENVELWIMLLAHVIKRNDLLRAKKTFDRGVFSLEEKSSPLWHIMVLYLKKGDQNMFKDFCEKGVMCPFPYIRTQMMVTYLEWWTSETDILQGRKLFKRLVCLRSPTKDLYSTMIGLENLYNRGIDKIDKIKILSEAAGAAFNKVKTVKPNNDKQ